ncbi:MAG: hypothetical protein JW744_04110 [Candidatus Diapherotrites archaeon]|uniref:Uncharacterized protein n=1 Tax=Candidatus Iainarchaeum sp. TaxID=3101447 RepID=A0A939CAC6_9ARCH|nr:hypothetical protein [Candidatus Diapherotrites archaeon]
MPKRVKPSALALNRRMKSVKAADYAYTPNGKKVLRGVVIKAMGMHGEAYDLYVFRGKDVKKLVVKKYRLGSFPIGKTQSSIAGKEYDVFQILKKKGFHVPPEIRMVEIKGEKYVALTDLAKFGSVRAGAFAWAKTIAEKFGIKKQAIEEVREYVERETGEAKKLGFDLNDAWEFLIDTKGKKIYAFIIDLGLAIPYRGG